MQYCDRMLHQPQRLHIKKRQQKRTEAQQLVSLQVRQMQLERKRLRVEEEKLECLRGIQSQLTLLTTAVLSSCGVQVVEVPVEVPGAEE